MISFNKDSAWDLKPIPVSDVRGEVNGLLIDGEKSLPHLRPYATS